MLLVDLGNSRIKWVRLAGRGLLPMHAAEHGRWRSEDFRQALFPRARGPASAASPRRRVPVLAVCVAPAVVRQRFAAAVRAATGASPRFVRSERATAGVRNGYRDVWRLGADRWVALIGARHCLPGRALCIADVGTATTIDLLDADGRHRGGVILPGPRLMVDSLLHGTGGIRRRAAGPRRVASPFARDTAAALQGGALYATAGAIDRFVREASRVAAGSEVALLLTGGGAAAVARHLETRHRLVPDLVLRGLAALALAPTDT
jgi:type III pantothenate kinase